MVLRNTIWITKSNYGLYWILNNCIHSHWRFVMLKVIYYIWLRFSLWLLLSDLRTEKIVFVNEISGEHNSRKHCTESITMTKALIGVKLNRYTTTLSHVSHAATELCFCLMRNSDNIIRTYTLHYCNIVSYLQVLINIVLNALVPLETPFYDD